MRQSIAVLVVCMLLMVAVIGGCFLFSVAAINRQVLTNRANGERIHALVCELAEHDHLQAGGC